MAKHYSLRPATIKKTRRRIPEVLLASLGLLIMMTACQSGDSGTAAHESNNTAASSSTSDSAAASPESSSEASPTQTANSHGRTRTVVLKATSSGTGLVVHGAGGSTSSEEFTGEWTKTVENVDKIDGYVLTVTGDILDDSSQVSCQIVVAGEVEEEASGSGSVGGATCILPSDFL